MSAISAFVSPRSLAAAALLVCFSWAAGTACSRLKGQVRPPGVPVGASYDRKLRIWRFHDPQTKIFSAYYSDGTLAQRGRQVGNLRLGTWRTFSLNGKVVTAIGRYKKGRRDGVWKFFDNKGGLYMRIPYAQKPVRVFGFFFHPDYGNENGRYERFFPSGRTEERGYFVGGYYHGPLVRYYLDGKVAAQGQYAKDQRAGQWRYYYPEGNLERIENYKKGLLHGEQRNFRPDGSLYHSSTYANGKPVGPVRFGP